MKNKMSGEMMHYTTIALSVEQVYNTVHTMASGITGLVLFVSSSVLQSTGGGLKLCVHSRLLLLLLLLLLQRAHK